MEDSVHEIKICCPENKVKILKRHWKSWKDSEKPEKMVKIFKRQCKSWKIGENPENMEKIRKDSESPEKNVKIKKKTVKILERHGKSWRYWKSLNHNSEKKRKIMKRWWKSWKDGGNPEIWCKSLKDHKILKRYL